MGYLWLEITLAHLRGIEPYEVMQALSAERRYPVPVRADNGMRVLTIWARTRAGRPFVVALRKVPDSRWDWWILGAREMTQDEAARFTRWETEAGEDD